jgi:hypothetical protein
MKQHILKILTGLSVSIFIILIAISFISDRFMVDAAVQNRVRTWYSIESQTGTIAFSIQKPTGTFDPPGKTPLGWPPPLMKGILISFRWWTQPKRLSTPISWIVASRDLGHRSIQAIRTLRSGAASGITRTQSLFQFGFYHFHLPSCRVSAYGAKSTHWLGKLIG